MSLINGNSHFSKSAVKDISRSLFDRPCTLLTSFSAGKLVPLYVDEVLPGDTVTMDMSLLCRMATPLYPVMDSAFIDVHWFFVPNRLLWTHWPNFMGETVDAWDDDVEYSVPQDEVSCDRGSLSDYMGLPVTNLEVAEEGATVCALPRRAYQLIWNEWYRDQNLQDSIMIDKGDATNSDPSIDVLLPVNKYKDYFTSCLPSPQRSSPVTIPVSSSAGGLSPVVTGPLHEMGGNISFGGTAYGDFSLMPNYLTPLALSPSSLSSGNGFESTLTGMLRSGQESSGSVLISRSNLYADLAGTVSSTTINQLRQAFAVQRLLERDARGGTRYRELVKAHFGVDIGDARVQIPEYLGGAHIPINVMQVVQQSSTSSEPSPLGETGAMSKTVYSGSMFTKSFVEHGWLMCLASVRTQHSYQQGIHRMWNRKTRYQFYWPELANLGEMAVLNKEIYACGDGRDNQVFGYQEAWADYRYRPNQITGNMRQFKETNDGPSSLAVWHYGDFYPSRPYLSGEWIKETDENIARTLAVSDTKIFDQFLCDCYFKGRWARPMPLYSIPGLIGHF